METRSDQHLVCESPHPDIHVVRFTCPDVRTQLYDFEAITDCSLYRELHACLLANLAEKDTVIINFGLIDPFPTAFYRLLLAMRDAVQSRKANLLLCCFTPNVRECFDLMGGNRVFEIRTSEARAVSEAKG